MSERRCVVYYILKYARWRRSVFNSACCLTIRGQTLREQQSFHHFIWENHCQIHTESFSLLHVFCDLRQLMALFHCMVRHSTVHFWGFSTGYSTWYFSSTTSAGVPSDPYRYQNVTCKLCWSLIDRRKSSLLRHWTCDTRPNIDPLDLNQHSQWRIGRNFLYQPKISVSLSVEEVQTFLSLIAEERIQRELDGATQKEKALCIYFLLFIYF